MTDAYQSPSNQQEDTSTTAITVGLLAEQETILENRGLSLELLANLGWRSTKNANAGNGWQIEIPYMVDGKEVNCKTRTLTGEKKFFQRAGAQKVFYNHDAIKSWQESASDQWPLLICEGEMDAVTAMQCGYLAVSVPDGAPAKPVTENDDGQGDRRESSKKYSYMQNFPKTGNVIICADGDDAGANLLRDLADIIGKPRCKWISYPRGCKDLNEVLVKYGEKGVHKTLERARWMEVDGVYRMSQLPPAPAHEPMACEVIPINLRTGEMSLWTGIPGHGKSTFTNYISFIAASKGWPIAVASFEQNPQTEHRYALQTLYIGQKPDYASQDEIYAANQWIDQHYAFIVPNDDRDDEDADLTWLFEKMRTAVARFGTKLFIIDPWNELDHMFDRREMNQTDYTGMAVKQLKKFARRYRVHVAVVAHPAKMKREKGGKAPIPNLHDVADSAHWANKPDLAVVIHRKDDGNLIRVAKSRYQDVDKIGKTGDYMVDYDSATKRFTKRPEATAEYSAAKKEKTLFDKDAPKEDEGF